MNIYITYAIIFAVLLALELLYFRIADRCNILDKPNERSSHSKIVLRGGGVIFALGFWVWSAFFGFQYPWALAAVTLAAGISFVDDIHSLPDSVRLVAQFIAMGLLILQIYLCRAGASVFGNGGWLVSALVLLAAMIVFVGAADIYNFMDGINGITAGYSLAVLVPLVSVNVMTPFVEQSLLWVICLAVLVFCFFNFRPKGKAKCFAGDVGSVGIAYILLFAIGMLIAKTGDVTYLVFLLVYGVDGCLTICHRIMLHENLGEAHRKHAYQLMANELGLSHLVVSLVYMAVQVIISIGFIYLCPLVADAVGWSMVVCHWCYLTIALFVLSIAYLIFMKKYYHFHEEYLAALERK